MCSIKRKILCEKVSNNNNNNKNTFAIFPALLTNTCKVNYAFIACYGVFLVYFIS